MAFFHSPPPYPPGPAAVRGLREKIRTYVRVSREVLHFCLSRKQHEPSYVRAYYPGGLSPFDRSKQIIEKKTSDIRVRVEFRRKR